MEGSPTDGPGELSHPARSGVLSRPIDLEPLWHALQTLRSHPMQVLLVVGVMLRIWVYLLNREYWMDEGSLLGNIAGRVVFDFSTHFSGDQLAPIGFLIVQRMVVGLLGTSGYVTRFVPLLCGVGSLWLFRSLAVRWLSGSSALVAMVLFAFSDDLVYYASEVKPYSSDLVIGLGLLVLASSLLGQQPAASRRLLAFALLAVSSPWFSFPSMFITAGCGMAILLDRALRRETNDLGWLLGTAACWSASCALSYLVSTWLLNPTTTMYVFWNFAFLPIPPSNRTDLLKLGGILLDVFVNPLNLLPPSFPAAAVVVPLVVWLLGASSFFRRNLSGFLVLVLPIALAIVASALRKFPFHGRLILELVPAFYLMIAEGTDCVRRRFGRIGYSVILVVLLSFFCLATLYEATGRRVRPFNAHGDLHDNRFVE